LEKAVTRNADMAAITDIKVLFLGKYWYDKIVADPRKMQKLLNMRIIKNIDFFKSWGMIKISEFNNLLGEKYY